MTEETTLSKLIAVTRAIATMKDALQAIHAEEDKLRDELWRLNDEQDALLAKLAKEESK